MRVDCGQETDELMYRRMGRWMENAASRTQQLEIGTSQVMRKRSRREAEVSE